MDILINTEILISTLQNVISVIDKSYSKPILSNFMIKTLDNEGGQGIVEFSATDYELSIIERIPAEITTSGSICINAKRRVICGSPFNICPYYWCLSALLRRLLFY